MWIERYVIIPVGLSINRMPFTWRIYIPAVEIFLTIGTISLFLLLYMLASRLIPLIPVWEVQEGQAVHMLRKIGRGRVPDRERDRVRGELTMAEPVMLLALFEDIGPGGRRESKGCRSWA